MLHKKKVYTIAIITILTLSMVLAAIPIASASPIAIITPIADSKHRVGDPVLVRGSNASAGGLVEVYWETTAPENLLNTTYADGAGNYSCYITVPEDHAGEHYIIVRDVSTGETIGQRIFIIPKITLTPTSGLPGDSVDVAGTGFAATSDVSIYFGNSTTELIVLSEPVGNGTGIVSNITSTLPHKSVPLSVNITLAFNTTGTENFTYPTYLNVYDNGTGGLYGNYTIAVNASGTVDYATGFFNITIETTETKLWVYSPANATYIRSLTTAYPADTATTSSLGSFTASFTVPDVIYENYTVWAIDASQNYADATFEVTATITITPDEGPTGTIVTITGRGFNETAGVGITITVGGITAPQVAPIQTIAGGNFTGEFIVPTVNVTVHDVEASDGTISATTTFNVTATTAVTLEPTAGQPGWEITIEGLYFTAIADTEVTVTFGALTVKTLYTNATGGFLGTFTVPSLPTGEYVVNATDENGLTATANFTIAITLIVLNPTSGPTGTVVTVTGYGFTTGGTANVTINNILVLTNIPVADLHAGNRTFIVPTLPVGTYTVTAKDNATLTASTTFEVIKTTELTLTPSSAPAGYTVNIEANYFTAVNETDITFIIKNATWSYDFTANITEATGFTATKTNATGSFKGTFIVNETWALGSYTINATDAKGLTVEVPFSIVTITVEMYTRALEYLQGDTVSFYIKSTFTYNMTIEIEDPTGYRATVSIIRRDWLTMGDFQVVPYEKAMFTLPSDAVLGTWNWTATIGTETEIGAFTVVEKPTLSIILDRLDELNVTLLGLITDAEGNLKAYIDTSLDPVIASLDEINAKLVSIENGVATINTTVGEIEVKLDALDLSAIDAKLTSINGTLVTVSTAIGDVQTSIDDIGLKVVDIKDGVATIETAVGTIQGKVTSIDGTVATIETNLGTVQADVSDIVEQFPVTVDMTPIWIAVVLSLIAAIAACYAAVTISRKIAG